MPRMPTVTQSMRVKPTAMPGMTPSRLFFVVLAGTILWIILILAGWKALEVVGLL